MACGDFMLMHKDDWATIHGHPEMPIYSMHLDSLTLVSADVHGIHEARLPPDFVHFHIEHGYGVSKDYVPNLSAVVESAAKKGIPQLALPNVQRMLPSLRHGRRVFAPVDWGMANVQLAEAAP